jgi:flagellar basal-body rod protein FlgB
VFDDIASVSLHTALSGLSLRQRVIADNISNVETPGYQAGRVNFEDALRAAVDSGTAITGPPALEKSAEASRENGNNVNLDDETLANVDTGLRYQITLRALDSKYSLLHDAIKGGV